MNAVAVFSGSYDLSETGPGGFSPGAWVCEGGVVTGVRVVVPPGGAVRCTITNTATSPTLTLVKVVDNGNTGATTPATAWELSAAGPNPISGTSGSEAVTAAPVQVGTYTLAESGPLGYEASAWVCVGADASTAASVTLTEGDHATCTITNTAIAPTLTLVKVVDSGSTGGTALPDRLGPHRCWPGHGDRSHRGRRDHRRGRARRGLRPLRVRGPAGYTASTWSCLGGTPGPDGVVLSPGDRATCAIVNTPVASAWELTKLADPPSGTVVDPGATITYTLIASTRAVRPSSVPPQRTTSPTCCVMHRSSSRSRPAWP